MCDNFLRLSIEEIDLFGFLFLINVCDNIVCVY